MGLSPRLTWNAVPEVDVNTSGGVYEVYRSVGTNNNYTLRATLSHTQTSYIDQAINIGSSGTWCYYIVKAKDIGGNLSAASNEGSIHGVDITQKTKFKETDLPEHFALEQNIPNPFNPVTTIRYALPKEALVVLKVYDVQGREVITLVNEFQEGGYKEINFDASTLPSGVYVYKLTAGTFTDVKKMVLIN